MSDAVIAALITGGLALVGVIITCHYSNKRTKDAITDEYRKANEEIKTEFRVAKAVTDTKIEELTREVRAHNNFAQRMPVVENEIKHINGEIKSIEKDIHKYHG